MKCGPTNLSGPDLGAFLAARLLLIGGAPRTGTSMLVRAFDWHPEVLMFPFEPNLFESLFKDPPAATVEYLRVGFLRPGAGKQAVLAHDDLLKRLRDSLTGQYRYVEAAGGFTHADSLGFRAAYARALDACGEITVRTALVSLAFAFASAVPAVGARYSQPRFLAVKVPFYVELAAAHFDDCLGRPWYIHVGRRPVGRYLSAKLRFMGKRGWETGLGMVNGTDFATAQAEISVASDHLRRENTSALGPRYLTLGYDRLSLRPADSMEAVARALGVSIDPLLRRQTLLGQPQHLPSSLGFTNGRPWPDLVKRVFVLMRRTSSAERAYVRLRFRAAVDRVAIGSGASGAAIFKLMRTPFPGESAESIAMRKAQAERLDLATWQAAATTARIESLARLGRLTLL